MSLNRDDKELIRLTESVNNFVKLNSLLDNDIIYHKVISCVHDLCSSILNCEKRKVEKEIILKTIEPARAIHRKSPFIKRLQDWPRGYPGDFETIEYLCNAEIQAPKNTLEYYCEKYSLNCPVAQQHRNKIQHQAKIIFDTFMQNLHLQKETKILSIACGSSRDIFSISNYIDNKDLIKIVLNDMDKAAIEFSQNRLEKLNGVCRYIHGYAMRKIRQFEKLGPFDLVIAGGLFDYLTDKHINFLLKNIYEKLLKPNGKIFFTNIAKSNLYRVWLEYCANWVLVERTEDDIWNFCEEMSINKKLMKIRRDETDLTLLVEIQQA